MTDAPRRMPVVTYAIIAANLVVFAIELAHGAALFSPTPQALFELGANFPPATLGGEPWRLGASMFLHFGIIHVGLNMLCLYQGRWIELIYGRIGFAVVYVVAGLAGGFAAMIATPYAVGAGASGAVFGVFGSFAAFLALRRATIDPTAWRQAVRQIVTFVGINLVFGLSVPGISVAAHVGGFLTGFAVGAALLVGKGAPRHPLRALALLVVAAAGTAVLLFTLPQP